MPESVSLVSDIREPMVLGETPAVDNNRLTTKVLTLASDLHALAADWKELFTRIRCSNVFLTHEWMCSWWAHFGSGNRLLVVEVRDADGMLVAIAPCYVSRASLGVRRLGLLADRYVGSEHLDILVDRRRKPACIREISKALDRNSQAWDYAEFCEVTENTENLTLLISALRDLGNSESALTAGVCPFLSVTDGLLQDPVSSRRKYRKFTRSLERAGIVDFQTFRQEPEADAAFEDLLLLHGARFSARGTTSGFSAVSAFHRQAWQLLRQSGYTCIYLLTLDKRPIAAVCGFSVATRMFFYQQGIDPRFSRFSPGWLAITRSVEHAVSTGHSELDFLKGDQAYKYQWASGSRRMFTYRVYRNNPAAVGIGLLHKSVRAMSYMKRRIASLAPAHEKTGHGDN